MKNKYYLFYYLAITLLFCLFNTSIYAQSNDCSGAVPLLPATTCGTNGYSITSGFTRDAIAAASCVTNANNREDGWFSFVADATSTTITATVTNANRNVALAIYQGGCGALSEVASGCANALGNGGSESRTITTVIGTTYLIRVIRFEDGNGNTMNGNICVVSTPPPITNDACTGAISLNVGQFECTSVFATNVNATYSGLVGNNPPLCGGTNSARDVWYKFVAPAGGQAAIDTNLGSLTNAAMELYRSTDGTCNTLTYVACNDNVTNPPFPTDNMPTITAYNLVAGNTYYVRVWGNGSSTGTFNICVQNQYSDCNVSLPLCSNSSFNTNSFGAGSIDTAPGSCFSSTNPATDLTEKQSIWVNFEIQTSGILRFLIAPQNPSDDYDFILYRDNGSFCSNINANGTVVSCNFASSVAGAGNTGVNGGSSNSQTGGGTNINANLNVTAGQRYFLLINNFANSSSGFDLNFLGTAGLDCVVLPLEFTEFRGEKIKDQNLLHWATARELGTSHFEIERSNDAMDFIKIGELKSGNQNLENQIYQYWDKEPQTGINYYRLKQVDLDGTFTYTKTIAIDNQGIITKFEIQKMYPNPAQNEINFVFAVPNQSELQLEVFNSNGQSVSKSSQNYSKGIQTFTQNLSSFSKGLYILRISNLKTGQVLIEKFIKN